MCKKAARACYGQGHERGAKVKAILRYFSILSNEINMQTVLCCVPCSPVRAEASHRAEMVSQLLFGERAAILEQGADHWVRIRCEYDGYEGWCQDSHLKETFVANEAPAAAMVSS